MKLCKNLLSFHALTSSGSTCGLGERGKETPGTEILVDYADDLGPMVLEMIFVFKSKYRNFVGSRYNRKGSVGDKSS